MIPDLHTQASPPHPHGQVAIVRGGYRVVENGFLVRMASTCVCVPDHQAPVHFHFTTPQFRHSLLVLIP